MVFQNTQMIINTFQNIFYEEDTLSMEYPLDCQKNSFYWRKNSGNEAFCQMQSVGGGIDFLRGKSPYFKVFAKAIGFYLLIKLKKVPIGFFDMPKYNLCYSRKYNVHKYTEGKKVIKYNCYKK